jgi:hypothetical protein
LYKELNIISSIVGADYKINEHFFPSVFFPATAFQYFGTGTRKLLWSFGGGYINKRL